MLRFEDYRSDKNFKLETLSYEEIFGGFKDVVNKIKKQNHDGVFKFQSVQLRKEKCECKMAYGQDRDLYPKIKLDMYDYVLIVSTFEVKLLVLNWGVEEIKSKGLDDALIELMCKHFPESDYLERRAKYFEDAELMRLF